MLSEEWIERFDADTGVSAVFGLGECLAIPRRSGS